MQQNMQLKQTHYNAEQIKVCFFGQILLQGKSNSLTWLSATVSFYISACPPPPRWSLFALDLPVSPLPYFLGKVPANIYIYRERNWVTFLQCWIQLVPVLPCSSGQEELQIHHTWYNSHFGHSNLNQIFRMFLPRQESSICFDLSVYLYALECCRIQ